MMDPNNYVMLSILLGSCTILMVLIALCIGFRENIFRVCRQSAVVAPEIEI